MYEVIEQFALKQTNLENNNKSIALSKQNLSQINEFLVHRGITLVIFDKRIEVVLSNPDSDREGARNSTDNNISDKEDLHISGPFLIEQET